MSAVITLSPDAVNAVSPVLSSSTPNTPPPCPTNFLDSTQPRISHSTACTGNNNIISEYVGSATLLNATNYSTIIEQLLLNMRTCVQ